MDLNAMISKGYLNSSQADAQIKAFDDFYNNFKTDQSSITSEQQTYLDSLEMNVKSVYDILIYNRDKARLLFKKAQILAIFDDLDTVLLMIPLQMLFVGLKPELFLRN